MTYNICHNILLNITAQLSFSELTSVESTESIELLEDYF